MKKRVWHGATQARTMSSRQRPGAGRVERTIPDDANVSRSSEQFRIGATMISSDIAHAVHVIERSILRNVAVPVQPMSEAPRAASPVFTPKEFRLVAQGCRAWRLPWVIASQSPRTLKGFRHPETRDAAISCECPRPYRVFDERSNSISPGRDNAETIACRTGRNIKNIELSPDDRRGCFRSHSFAGLPIANDNAFRLGQGTETGHIDLDQAAVAPIRNVRVASRVRGVYGQSFPIA